MTAPQPLADETPRVAHDRFPVTVRAVSGITIPGRPDEATEVRTARAIITCPTATGPARIMVWTRPGPPALDAPVDLAESVLNGNLADPWLVATPAGVVEVHREPGGCCVNGALRGWMPWTPWRMGSLA